MGTETIQTQRLKLRKLRVEDSSQMYANWASDSKVTRYLSWPPHDTIETVKALLVEKQELYMDPNYFDWGIEVKQMQELIGTITVVKQHEKIQTFEIGYAIGKNWWGNGYVAEALRAVVFYLFQETKVNRIEAAHDINNENSGKVLQKAGFTYEGTFKKRGVNTSGIVDISIYSILRNDWENAKGIH
ncbi:GNAT family N-acetyltransferase [Tetragenococcus koreensis]|uniref:GNAT family N-acetyltransferase n=1 Tax=Tetragenococcus solitarius TaxID=71453 RepID=A0ABN3Y1R8_9ENTE|nr:MULTISPECIES: GNAT family protein [Tetragenococcus]MDN6639729.1 GNAT family N-acetyltransferase [Tetragenococcus sp.]MDN6836364.1 GNAT family N-acetyltransferase [Lactococcus lactis]MCF1584432.1 GNAT family N-acetyltransferase [Tetragenococcus koreensis]MCF1613981.1 GNAT family N-acetyltransferase [Tetragenococcus koreensis]MCF1619804.1 GNAT family N-acetyltransferase [Tetragenococcus koreensis]